MIFQNLQSQFTRTICRKSEFGSLKKTQGGAEKCTFLTERSNLTTEKNSGSVCLLGRPPRGQRSNRVRVQALKINTFFERRNSIFSAYRTKHSIVEYNVKYPRNVQHYPGGTKYVSETQKLQGRIPRRAFPYAPTARKEEGDLNSHRSLPHHDNLFLGNTTTNCI